MIYCSIIEVHHVELLVASLPRCSVCDSRGASCVRGVTNLVVQSCPNNSSLSRCAELLKACFALEQVVAPHRPPSATIAVNKHAQFRPHRDTGAGNGQSNSLIVALGDFSGGGESGLVLPVGD